MKSLVSLSTIHYYEDSPIYNKDVERTATSYESHFQGNYVVYRAHNNEWKTIELGKVIKIVENGY